LNIIENLPKASEGVREKPKLPSNEVFALKEPRLLEFPSANKGKAISTKSKQIRHRVFFIIVTP